MNEQPLCRKKHFGISYSAIGYFKFCYAFAYYPSFEIPMRMKQLHAWECMIWLFGKKHKIFTFGR